MSKKNEIKVDEIINSYGPTKKAEPSESKTKNASSTGWDDDEADNGNSGFLGSDSKSGKKKASKVQKNPNVAATWGDKKEPEPVEVKQETTQPATKARIMNKPGQAAKKPDVNVNEFDFPELGQEAAPKKEEVKQEQPKPVVPTKVTTTSSAPVKFLNKNKEKEGENFVKIEAPVEKVPEPKVETKPVTQTTSSDSQPITRTGFGFRRDNKQEEKPAEEETGKIKFGGEGPVKFHKADKAKTKEETKTQEELLREQKEKEVEEKLQKEREEARKKMEERKKKEANAPPKQHSDGKPFHRKSDQDEEAKANENHHTEKKNEDSHHSHKNDDQKTSQHENKEQKQGGAKFSNSKKNQNQKEQPKPQPEVIAPVVTDPKELEPQETKEVVTKASTAGWSEGGLIKRKKN